MTAIKSESQLSIDFERKVLETPARLLAGLVRGSDSLECQHAAVRQLEGRTELQRRILHVLATEGPLTDRELESRAEFRGYGPSTVRKRRSELFQAKALIDCGRRDRLTLWDIRRVEK